MSDSLKLFGIIGGAIVFTVILSVMISVWLVGGNQSAQPQEFGGGTRFPNGLSADSTSPSAGQVRGTSFLATGTFQAGSSGTSFQRVNGGTCYIRPYAATIAASSSAQVDCQNTAAWSISGASALTGVTFGDAIVATLATSTAGTTSNGLTVTGSQASSTSGYITLFVSNLTGTTFTWPTTGNASGTASYVAMK